MDRLTVKGVLYGDFYSMGSKAHDCLNRLSKYEDTDLKPEEIEQLKSELDFWHIQAIKWAAQLGELRLKGDLALAEYEHRVTDDRNGLITKIEKAMNFKLFDHQIRYIFDDVNIFPAGRVNGKTTAYCIKLALSKGEAIDMRHRETMRIYEDVHCGPSYSLWFKDRFNEIYCALLAAGLPVRQVIF